MNISHELERLGITAADYVVVGSGVMGAVGIRHTDDIDLCVSQPVYDRFMALGWEEKEWPKGAPTIHKGAVDMGTDWGDDKNIYTFNDLKKHVVVIDDINYVSLEFLRAWKLNKGREKDLRDVDLIDNYLREHPSS